MLSLEKLASANIKNRAEYAQLFMELSRIEKEKRNELRMLNNEKQRFRARYSKTTFGNAESLNEASDVKMYETHNPGFCYKRNGEHRVQQVSAVSAPIDFEHLHFLLFTDGEVDIEKLLCLHLLSSHETEHLTPPRRLRALNRLLKRDSPLEQLIERSEEFGAEAVSSTILPTYILDINKENIESSAIDDERLMDRLLVNEKILELITTVITALEESNPAKVQHLVDIAEDTSSLKRIFRKTHIQEFVMTLKDHSLVNSCSSFILTQPMKLRPNHIEIRTPTGALEDLVRLIRENVLQLPNRPSFRTIDERELKNTSALVEIPSLTWKKSTESPRQASPRPEVRKDSRVVVDDAMKFRRTKVNYVTRNIAAIPTYQRNSDDTAPPKPKKMAQSSPVASRRTSVDSKKTVTKHESTKRKSEDDEKIRFHLKQTTCPACMVRWKVPLPPPKVSGIAKMDSPNSSDAAAPKTNSAHRISMLIEREQYKLSSYDTKYSNSSTGSTLYQRQKKGGMGQRSSCDLVDLDVYDLEKIRQEIREREAKKKLEKFLYQ